jgi:predicted transcriptional regulator
MAPEKRDKTEDRLVKIFGSTSRPRILGLLVRHPRQAYYQREIMYETGLSLQTVQRELENLFSLGILKKRETKTRVYYQINVASAWFRPLREICGVKYLTEKFSQIVNTSN